MAGGLFATLLAAGIAATGLDVEPSLVVTASIVMLLAGIGFVGATQDALSGFPLTAGARSLEAMLATAGIIAGVSGGFDVAGALGLDLGRLDPGVYDAASPGMLTLGAAVASAAFAFSSYAPGRALLPVALVGALASLTYNLTVGTVAPAWSTAVAAVTIGVISYSVSGRIRVPPLVVVMCGVVPLLPGLAIYRGLAELALGQGGGTLSLVGAAATAIGLASGAILGQYVAQPLKREARRLETRLAGPRLVGTAAGRTAAGTPLGPSPQQAVHPAGCGRTATSRCCLGRCLPSRPESLSFPSNGREGGRALRLRRTPTPCPPTTGRRSSPRSPPTSPPPESWTARRTSSSRASPRSCPTPSTPR